MLVHAAAAFRACASLALHHLLLELGHLLGADAMLGDVTLTYHACNMLVDLATRRIIDHFSERPAKDPRRLLALVPQTRCHPPHLYLNILLCILIMRIKTGFLTRTISSLIQVHRERDTRGKQQRGCKHYEYGATT